MGENKRHYKEVARALLALGRGEILALDRVLAARRSWTTRAIWRTAPSPKRRARARLEMMKVI